MTNDKEIELIKLKYALLAKNLFTYNINSDYVEYVYSILNETEKKHILKFIKNEFQKYKNKLKEKDKNKLVESTVFGVNVERIENMLFSDNKFSRIFSELDENLPHIHNLAIQEIVKTVNVKIKKKTARQSISTKLDELTSVFKLNKNESEIVLFLYLIVSDQYVDNFFDSRYLNMTSSVKGISKFARLFQIKPKELREIFSKDGKLFRFGILDKISGDDRLRLSDSIVSFLSGYEKINIFDNYLKTINNEETLPLDKLNVSKQDSEIVLNLLKAQKGVNIILYGEPGTGKTEFAKSLGDKLGKKVFFVKQKDKEGEEDLSFRKAGIIAAQSLLEANNSLIVIDEAESIIRTKTNVWSCDKRGDNKAWINDLLESTKHKIIWITNSINEIDDSSKRRFSYSLGFKKLSQKQRHNVWTVQNSKIINSFLNENDITNLSRKYHVSAGTISLALNDINSMGPGHDKNSKMIMLNKILEKSQEFIQNDIKDSYNVTQFYSSNYVNTDVDINVLLDSLKKFINLDLSNNVYGVINMNILFHGAPGTGKTEFAKHIAEQLDKELLVKRLSDIRSKYYGEDLQNIAAMFKEALESEKILFLDEADTFFMNREEVNEHYRSETNELLTQMENFKGIMICATNFTSALDPAVLRRFNHKVKFDFLKCDTTVEIFRSMFEKSFNLSINENDLLVIRSLKYLTPGDFKVVYQKNIFLENVSKEKLINDLIIEASYKKQNVKRIGIGLN